MLLDSSLNIIYKQLNKPQLMICCSSLDIAYLLNYKSPRYQLAIFVNSSGEMYTVNNYIPNGLCITKNNINNINNFDILISDNPLFTNNFINKQPKYCYFNYKFNNINFIKCSNLSSGWYVNKNFKEEILTDSIDVDTSIDIQEYKNLYVIEPLTEIKSKDIYKVGIIIPIYNQSDYTIKCLKSIDKYYENKYDINVILVDNGSDQLNKEKVNSCIKELKNIKIELLEYPTPLGYVKATNAGILKGLELECDYICLQNNDTEVSKNWLSLLIKPIKNDVVGTGPTTNSKLAVQRI